MVGHEFGSARRAVARAVALGLAPSKNSQGLVLPAVLYTLSAWFASASLGPEDIATFGGTVAASLASAGGRVVLIDADLRRPSVHKYFNLSSGLPGIVEIITGLRRVDEVKIPDVIKRVTVIPSGRIPPNPAELLGSLEMANLIDRLANEYDYVLIDSPPILPVTDSVILSRYVDGVVLVVKGAATPKKVVRDARSRLEAVGARVLGAILNNVDVTGGDYYYYNRYYYSYYQENEASDNSSKSQKAAG